MLRFGGNGATFADMPVSGNVGIRYVETENASRGFLRYPVIDSNWQLASSWSLA